MMFFVLELRSVGMSHIPPESVVSEGNPLASLHAGMHALQILPLAGYWVSERRSPGSFQVSYTAVFFVAYLAVMAALFWQAWQGHPMVPIG
jgi:hypothetical protein